MSMKQLALAGILVLALLAALPSAQAQVPPTLSLTVTSLTAPIPYMGSAPLHVAVLVSCAALDPTASLSVAVGSPPAWLTATPFAPTLSAADCIGSSDGFHTYEGDIPLTVTADAPGVVDHMVNVTAALSTSSPTGGLSDTKPTTFTVAYHVSYTLKTDATFPFKMTTPKATFNLTITQASNARSMVMMESVKSTSGVVSGLASQVYECDAGKPATKTFKVTYAAPTGAWDKSTVSFTAYGHFLLLDSRAGPFDVGTPTTWEFDNGGIPATEHTASKKSPEPVGPLVALGLVGLAAVLRRRD
jgi:uncharacterized protein (TIGR03382 family)